MKTWIITLSLGALAALAVSSLHLAKADTTQAGPTPENGCEASVRCLDDGRCEITCTRPDGQTCTIELACDTDGCRIVDCDGPADCDPADCDPADCGSGACAPASCAPAAGSAN